MIASLGDDGSTITVAHQNHRTAHGVDGGLRVLLVLGVGGLWGLRYRHRVAILLEDLRDGFPAGAIGKCSMHQNHVLDTSLRCRTRRGSIQSRTHQHRPECSNDIKLRHDVSPVRFHFVSFLLPSRASQLSIRPTDRACWSSPIRWGAAASIPRFRWLTLKVTSNLRKTKSSQDGATLSGEHARRPMSEPVGVLLTLRKVLNGFDELGLRS